MSDRAFSFLNYNQRQAKPRSCGLTEIRGPYYSPMGKHYLEDVLETMGEYVDSSQVRRWFFHPHAACRVDEPPGALP